MAALFLFPLLQMLLILLLGFTGIFILLRYYLLHQRRSDSAAPPPASPADGDSVVRILLPLRLQACERFVLYLERIHPSNLLLRLNDPSLSAVQLQAQLIRTIREEFEYNLSQQLYISGPSWELIRNAKEEMIAMVNRAASGLDDKSRSADLVKGMLELMVEKGKLPSEVALEEIKQELRRTF